MELLATDHAPGVDYDATLEAASHGIRVRYDSTAPDVGTYCPNSRTITVRGGDRTYTRTTIAYQLGHAVLEDATMPRAVSFAAERLIDDDDLVAIASVTDDRTVWATVLRVRECLLRAHIAIRAGLPVAA